MIMYIVTENEMSNSYYKLKSEDKLNIIKNNLKNLNKRIDCDINYVTKEGVDKDKILNETKEQIENIISFIDIKI